MKADYLGNGLWKGFYSCSCHPFYSLEAANEAAKQKFKLGEKVKHRCTGKIGEVYELKESFYLDVKFGDRPCDIHLEHSQDLLKI